MCQPLRLDARGHGFELRQRHAALRHVAEPHAADSARRAIGEKRIAHVRRKNRHAAKVLPQLGDCVQCRAVVRAVDRGLDDDAALDAERAEHRAVIRGEAFGRRVAPPLDEGEAVERAEDVRVTVAGAAWSDARPDMRDVTPQLRAGSTCRLTTVAGSSVPVNAGEHILHRGDRHPLGAFDGEPCRMRAEDDVAELEQWVVGGRRLRPRRHRGRRHGAGQRSAPRSRAFSSTIPPRAVLMTHAPRRHQRQLAPRRSCPSSASPAERER